MKKFISWLFLYCFFNFVSPVFGQYELSRILNTKQGRQNIASFIDSVLKIISSNDLFKSYKNEKTPLENDVLYRYLKELRSSTVPFFPLIRKFQILQSQKSCLSGK